MKITIELRNGRNHDSYVTKKDIQKNIDALQRIIDGKAFCGDFMSLSGTKSILKAMQKQLPDIL